MHDKQICSDDRMMENDSYSEDDDYDKRYDDSKQEMSVSIINANNNTSGSLDFSAENDICTDNEDNDMLNDAPLATSTPYHNARYEREEDFEEYERKIYEQLYGINHTSEISSSKESTDLLIIDDNLSDSDAEMLKCTINKYVRMIE
jgi:hypothetical protein